VPKSSVELVDLSGNACPQIPDYPVPIEGHVAALIDDRIISCGGFDGFEEIANCFELDDGLNWNEIDSLPTALAYAAGSIVGGYWVISGGEDGDTIYDTTYIYDDNYFQPGPPMPSPFHTHCQLTLDETHVFIGGGHTKEAYLYDIQLQEFITLPELPILVYDEACGLLENDQSGQEIMLIEGHNSLVYSLTNNNWRDGPVTENTSLGPAAAQLEDGFALVGGEYNGQYFDTIYTIDDLTYSWYLDSNSLNNGRQNPTVVTLPDGFITC